MIRANPQATGEGSWHATGMVGVIAAAPLPPRVC